MAKKSNEQSAAIAVGLAVFGILLVGATGEIMAISAFANGESIAAGVCLGAAALAFGFLVNAVFRR